MSGLRSFAKTFGSFWLKHPDTYPLGFCILAGTGLVVTFSWRTFQKPDICVNPPSKSPMPREHEETWGRMSAATGPKYMPFIHKLMKYNHDHFGMSMGLEDSRFEKKVPGAHP